MEKLLDITQTTYEMEIPITKKILRVKEKDIIGMLKLAVLVVKKGFKI